MAAKKILKMECDVCGTEIVVSTSGASRLEPILCCGLEVVEVSGSVKKEIRKKNAGNPGKKITGRKKVKKTAGKKTSRPSGKTLPAKKNPVRKTVKKKAVAKKAATKKKAAKKKTVRKTAGRATRRR